MILKSCREREKGVWVLDIGFLGLPLPPLPPLCSLLSVFAFLVRVSASPPYPSFLVRVSASPPYPSRRSPRLPHALSLRRRSRTAVAHQLRNRDVSSKQRRATCSDVAATQSTCPASPSTPTAPIGRGIALAVGHGEGRGRVHWIRRVATRRTHPAALGPDVPSAAPLSAESCVPRSGKTVRWGWVWGSAWERAVGRRGPGEARGDTQRIATAVARRVERAHCRLGPPSRPPHAPHPRPQQHRRETTMWAARRHGPAVAAAVGRRSMSGAAAAAAATRRPVAVGIRREDKNRWERRVPLMPGHVRRLVDDGVSVQVQTSTRRVVPDVEFQQVSPPYSP